MLKILTHYAHGTYQSSLSQIPGVKYYHVIDEECALFQKSECPQTFWADRIPLPRNIFPIKATDVDPSKYHAILTHWHPFIEPFHLIWQNLPIIFTEHTWPYLNMPSEVLKWKAIREKYCKHTVFITPSSREAWGESNNSKTSHIYHSIDIDTFPQKIDYSGKQIMTTTNEFISRDWACGFSLWVKTLGIPNQTYFDDIALYGYGNSNIGKKFAKESRTREEILNLLTKAGVYFNPSIMSPIPMSLLEAAAVGTPIVSTEYCEPGKIFKNNVHGIFSNDPIELRKGIKFILDNPEVAKKMANEAKKIVLNLFKPIIFQKEWKKLFKSI